MKKLLYSFTKSARRNKRLAREANLVNWLRFAQYEVYYRDKVIESKAPGIGNNISETITISLTSYGPRIETVYLTIESLMQQSLKADRIVLCLAKNEFTEANLPASLKNQRERGLEILFCDEDIGPYTKFFYTLQKYPEDLIITVDDDLIYPVDTVSALYNAYLKEPEVIHCNRAHQMLWARTGQLLPYRKWQFDKVIDTASLCTFPTGVGGVLYFPGSLDDSVFDKETFLKLAPNADDVWLKAMSLKKSVKCRRVQSPSVFTKKTIAIPGSQVVSLKRKNKHKRSGNDLAISQVFDKYDIHSIIGGALT